MPTIVIVIDTQHVMENYCIDDDSGSDNNGNC